MSRRQGGQALVGALVVTTLAFLMAGAVAVGASALLSQESNNGPNASSRDLSAQDALAAAVAVVAGKGSTGGSAPCSSPQTPFTATLPSTYVSNSLCTRVDGVLPAPVTLVKLHPQSPPGCPVSSQLLPNSPNNPNNPNNQVRIWFSATGKATDRVSAWVDDDSSVCSLQSDAVCSVTQDAPPVAVPFAVIQVRLKDCPLGGSALYLHIQSSAQSPALVWLADYSNSPDAGSIYMLAASTGLAGGPAYEEADLWVSADGQTTKLLFEGTL
jgi:hypothetical protein